MINFADENTFQHVRKMWKDCFNDTDEFIDLYFSEKYDNRNTLIYFDENTPVASLQMLMYIFTFYGEEISSAYISGACTVEPFRNKGYMRKLLKTSLEVIQNRQIPLSILIPAETWLYSYYAKFGYEKVFDKDDEPILLKSIWEKASVNINEAYSDFDKIFRSKDFCVQKSKKDFITIYKDILMNNFPPKTNLSGMVRIINAEKLLSIFAFKNPEKSFLIKLNDNIITSNNGIYKVDNGTCTRLNNPMEIQMELDINLLCRLLFGYQIDKIGNQISSQFKTHKSTMNFMLE
jgi:predicted acetyltransferase